jgi:hemerythrin superfamily protein
MPTNAKTKEKKKSERQNRQDQPKREQRSRKSEAMSALDLLEHDHREVEQMFDKFGEVDDDKKKQEIARELCMMLTVHARIEEEIFYPEVRKATHDDDLVDESLVEHESAKHLISEIQNMRGGDDLFEARVKVLEEQMKRHIMEEEEELFPEVTDSSMDLDKVGERMAQRKAELMKEVEGA